MYRNRIVLTSLLVGFGLTAFAQLPLAPAQLPPDPRYKADILLVVAHPDDETAIGGYLARAVFDEHRRVAIIYCNRGGGGGNSVGNEQSIALGQVREIEARRAVASFGITNVWFLEGRDTPGQDIVQSFENWHHGLILEGVVRLIRLTRPEVVITWLPHYVSGENHGDHQASGVIATEAFDLAGDPTVFPEQVMMPRERTDINNAAEGLRPWQAKKIYYFSDASHLVKGPGPRFDLKEVSPAKKVTYARLAADLHLTHRTQADVSEVAERALASGDFSEFTKWLEIYTLLFGKATVECDPSGEVFEGVTSSPAAFVPAPGYKEELHHGVSLELGGVFAFYHDFRRAHGIEHLGPLVPPEVGIGAGSYFHLPLIVRNSTPDTVEVSLIPTLPAGWKEASGSARYRLAPGEVYAAQTFIHAPSVAQPKPADVIWEARTVGKVIGRVGISVAVVDWALPE